MTLLCSFGNWPWPSGVGRIRGRMRSFIALSLQALIPAKASEAIVEGLGRKAPRLRLKSLDYGKDKEFWLRSARGVVG